MVDIYPNCNRVAAHHKDAAAKTHSIGRQIAGKAEALLETVPAHRTGDSRINYYEGTVDAVIELDDSRGLSAARAIEYGRSDSVTYFEGVYVLQKATNGVR